MSGLELYLLIAPMVLLALGWGCALWVHHIARRPASPSSTPSKAG